MEITEQIKTYEDACKVLGIDPVKALPFKKPADQDELATNAYFKLVKIAKGLNEGWKPDWSDSNQWKYYPWFDMRPKNGSGLGLSFGVCAYDRSGSTVGSRLCFHSEDLATYFGEQFIELHAEQMVIREG